MARRNPRGRPPAAEAPASLTDMLSTALRVFAKFGFEGTSVAALNRELGVSHNLLHQRFGSKEALWYASVDWAFGRIADEITVDEERAEHDLMEATKVTIRRFLQVHARHPEMLRLVSVEAASESPRLTYLYEAHVAPLHARLTAPLKSLVDRGVLREVDIRSLHFLVAHGATAPFSLVPFAQMLNSVDPLDPDAVREHADFVAEMVVAGLRARGASDERSREEPIDDERSREEPIGVGTDS
jgi:TetR/AcrR family transcriptional regulator